MAKIPTQVTRTVTPSGRAAGAFIPSSLADTGQGAIGEGLSKLGSGITQVASTLSQIATKTKQVEDNNNVANGIAEYNNIINTFNETLPTTSPDDYMGNFEKLEGSIGKLTEGMSGDAANALNNKLVVWNEQNRASTAALAVKQKASLAKQELPGQLASFIANDQLEEADQLIEGYGDTVLSPEEVGLWKEKAVQMKGNHDMWESINDAVLTQSNKEVAVAEQNIRTFYKNDPQKEFSTLGTLRAKMGATKQAQTEARKAQVNAESQNIMATVTTGAVYEQDVTPENQTLVNQINGRIANGSLDDSDGITYNDMSQQVLTGKFFTQQEIMEGLAGTEFGGMSKEETNDLIKSNADNEKLTLDQRDQLASYGVEVDNQYGQLKGIARLKLSETLQARVFGAVEEDKREFKRELKRLVLAGETPETLELAIKKNFIADSTKYVKGSFKRFFNAGVNDFTDTVLTTTDREKENEIMLDLLKSGAVEGNLVDNIEDLFERFNQ